MTHPTFFIAFLCHNIFQDSKIGNIFEETFLKKFSKAKSFENILCENQGLPFDEKNWGIFPIFGEIPSNNGKKTQTSQKNGYLEAFVL